MASPCVSCANAQRPLSRRHPLFPQTRVSDPDISNPITGTPHVLNEIVDDEEMRCKCNKSNKSNFCSTRRARDRINNSGNDEPGDCRWATRREQSRNRRTTRLIAFNGETHCVIKSPSGGCPRLQAWGGSRVSCTRHCNSVDSVWEHQLPRRSRFFDNTWLDPVVLPIREGRKTTSVVGLSRRHARNLPYDWAHVRVPLVGVVDDGPRKPSETSGKPLAQARGHLTEGIHAPDGSLHSEGARR